MAGYAKVLRGLKTSAEAAEQQEQLLQQQEEHEEELLQQERQQEEAHKSMAGAEKAETLSAEAPVFVPFSQMQQFLGESQGKSKKKGKRSSRQGPGSAAMHGANAAAMLAMSQGWFDPVYDMVEQPPTTMIVSGIEPEMPPEGFKKLIDSLGLSGTYDFLYMPLEPSTKCNAGYAFMNVIDPLFVYFSACVLQDSGFESALAPVELQSVDGDLSTWVAACVAAAATANGWPTCEDSTTGLIVDSNPVPTQWAINGVNSMLAPQLREQFHKTKLCTYYWKGHCEMGYQCPYAHTEEELMPAPDLCKTKLCYNFFRGKCSDSQCKFAHGSKDLRVMPWLMPQQEVPYSPGIWYFGDEGEGSLDQGGAGPRGCPDDLLQAMGYEAFPDSGFGSSPATGSLLTAPAAEVASLLAPSTAESWDAGPLSVQGVHLAVRGTFMEALQVKDEEEYLASRKRAWSDGDLPAFRDVMDAESTFEEGQDIEDLF